LKTAPLYNNKTNLQTKIEQELMFLIQQPKQAKVTEMLTSKYDAVLKNVKNINYK
jgi:hypothetical protein